MKENGARDEKGERRVRKEGSIEKRAREKYMAVEALFTWDISGTVWLRRPP